MTLPAHSEPLGGRLPSMDDRQIANQLRQILAAHKDGGVALKVHEPQSKERVEVTLTPAVSELFLELLRHIGRGSAVTLVPIQEKLTTQQAADILNISRPYLIKLLEQGVMAHTLVGRHRRIDAEEVFAYKDRRDAERASAMEELLFGDSDLI